MLITLPDSGFLILVYTKECEVNGDDCISDDPVLVAAGCQALGSSSGGLVRYTCGCAPGLARSNDHQTCTGRVFRARLHLNAFIKG